MELSEFKKKLLDTKIQLVKLDSSGVVKSSDNTLFKLAKGKEISGYHLFFESLSPLFQNLSETLQFPAVNLNIDGKALIADIELIPESDEIYMVIYDFSDHYTFSQGLVQEKNESAIAKYRLAFEKDLLLAKEGFKNKFIAHFNHELRNPLNSLLGFLDILILSKVDYEQREILNLMHRTGSNLKSLVDDLLDLSKVEKGILDLKEVPFGLSALLNSLVKQFGLRYERKKINLELEYDPDLPSRMMGDPVRLNQILINLLENAFKNTSKGSVKLTANLASAEQDTLMVEFKISDTGVGISEENLPRIFDSYFQIELDEIKPIGEGLGLSIVKELTELLGGTVKVQSVLGEGTEFTLSIPFRKLEKKGGREKRKTVPKGSGIMKGIRVLVVEDDEANQLLLMKNFIDQGQFYVEIANNGDMAIDLIDRRKYDIILLNMQVPERDGFEVMAYIRQHESPKIQDLPVLVTSGMNMPDEQKRIKEAGANGFVAKPYSKRELFESITKLT